MERPTSFWDYSLSAKATFISYEGTAAALDGATTTKQKSLNGNWKFQWASVPEEAPKHFYEKNSEGIS